MLKILHLQNFKAFANQQIALPALTVFTGVNGVGKSSFIQSLPNRHAHGRAIRPVLFLGRDADP